MLDVTLEISLLQEAWQKRVALFEQFTSEKSEAYRLFHGVNEGMPGVTVDRYGALILLQSFRELLSEEQVKSFGAFYQKHIPECSLFAYNHRTKGAKQDFESIFPVKSEVAEAFLCQELGISYWMCARHEGNDPLFFLDMRAGRRWMSKHAQGASVLNLFAYTCTMGVVAAAHGAEEVCNVDFSKTYLEWGERNVQANPQISAKKVCFLESDVLPALRQFAGLPIKGRARKRKYPRVQPRQFDIVFLDPPTWSRSPFGAVDIVRDYQSLFKPAWLATAEGGVLMATNHAAVVEEAEWHQSLYRCAEKAGRSIKKLEKISPEEDFPSPDGRHPLKIALCWA